MTNLNEVTIVDPSQSPGGTQIAITDVTTTGPGQTILVVPGSQSEWAEVTIEACNITGTDFCLVMTFGNASTTDLSGHILKKLTAFSGVSTMIDGRILRGGMTIGARCLNAAASGGGTPGAINVYVRPPILHKRTKAVDEADQRTA